jgi:hypothetical protein
MTPATDNAGVICGFMGSASLSAVDVGLLAAMVDEAALLVFKTNVEVEEARVLDGTEECEEEETLDEDKDTVAELEAADDAPGEVAVLEGVLDVVVNDGRSLVVACRRNLAGACNCPTLDCTHSSRQVRARSQRHCIFAAASGDKCGLEARQVGKTLPACLRKRCKDSRDGMLRLGEQQAESLAGYASGCNQLSWTTFVNHKGAGLNRNRKSRRSGRRESSSCRRCGDLAGVKPPEFGSL